MSNVIGSGVIEVSADSRKLTAGIDEAKKSLKSLGIAAGDATKGQSASIDRYVKSLGQAAVTAGKTGRELELYKLALRGATAEQLKAADSALRMTEAYGRGERIGQQIKAGLLSIGAAAATGLIASFVAFDQLAKKAGDFQDMAEKTGDTAENIASLALAAGTAGASMETVVSASNKLTKGLTGVDDESKAAGAAIAALGLNIKDFKALAPADQMEAVAKALGGFQEGAEKTAVAMALFGKSGADLLPFLKELGAEGGRQVILTQSQIEQADAYADKQAKLRTELGLHAQAIATQMVPAYNALTEALIEVSKEILGVKDGASTLTQDNSITEFAESSAKALAVVADAAFMIGQGFNFAGNNIAAAAAQAVAIAKLDFAGAGAIGRASNDFNDNISFSLGLADKLEKKLASIGKKSSSIDPRLLGSVGTIAEQDAANNPKKKLDFKGVDPKAKDTAAKQAKAQLDLDLENIKSASGQLIATYANSEKIMQAMRAAGLVDEQDYYASKLAFLRLNTAAQEDALEKEIARLDRENLAGADRLANEKKIAEARAKLATTKASGSAGVAVLGIQSEAATTSRTKEVDAFFADAQAASKARSIANVEAIRQSLLTEVEVENEAYVLRLDALTAFNDSRLEGEAGVNLLIEEEKRRHEETLLSIKQQSDQMMLSAASGATSQLYDLLKQAGLEQTALGKVAFIASKALAVAQIILSTNVAAAAALALPPIGLGPVAGLPMAGFIKTMGYASAAMTAGLAIAEASAEGGYDIPDGKNPIVQTHAKEMILPRAQANVIRDLAKDGGSKSSAITIVNNTSAKIGKVTEQTLSNGERAILLQEAVSATAAALNDPNSKTSRALSRNYATQRSR